MYGIPILGTATILGLTPGSKAKWDGAPNVNRRNVWWMLEFFLSPGTDFFLPITDLLVAWSLLFSESDQVDPDQAAHTVHLLNLEHKEQVIQSFWLSHAAFKWPHSSLIFGKRSHENIWRKQRVRKSQDPSRNDKWNISISSAKGMKKETRN